LNDALLNVLARLQDAPAAGASAIHAEAAKIIQARAAALQELIEENPSEALKLRFSPEVLETLVGLLPESAGRLESYGTWKGKLESLVEDAKDMKGSRSIHQLTTATETLDIHFAENVPSGATSGVFLEVSGMQVGGQVAAYGGAVDSTGSDAPAMCRPIGDQKTLVLLVTFPGVPAPNITPASVQDTFFKSSGRSLTEYWRDASYGSTTASGDVLGWYTLDANYTCSQSSSIRDAALRAADRDVDFTKYSRIFIIFPDGTCSWGGLANVGCTTLSSAGDGIFTSSVAWLLSDYFTNSDDGVRLAAHEGGHNLGLGHANSRDFGTEPLAAPGVQGTVTEYGDPFSAMSWSFGQYSSSHKSMLGWLSNGSGIQTVTTSGTFSLQPLEGLGSARALKIARGSTGSWVWLEYRTPMGPFDSHQNPSSIKGAVVHI
jgi:M6 family metalloprotease-like protein